MKLYGWQNVNSAQEYREMIQAEYERLKAERSNSSEGFGLEEVKLRLFLSLLDKKPVDVSSSVVPQNQDGQDLSSPA
jgi:hypothetical protein